MENFTYQNPVKILFGKGQIAAISNEIPKDKRILITYGGGSIKNNGVYDQVIKALDDHNVFEFGGIEPNPRYETLMKAVEVVKKEKIDFLLAVGGGSVLDGTKFIAAAVPYKNGDPWNILLDAESGWSSVKAALPLASIMTLPATGSEMNCGAVITKEATKDKLHFVNPNVYPQFSVLDPTTTFSLPPRQTANGVIDAFVHTMEQYLTFPVDAKLQDRMAEGTLQTLIEDGPKALKDPNNYDARANIMWSATIGLNGWLGLGVPQDWATHMIGHELTAAHGLDHGITLAIIMPSVMNIKHKNKHAKLLQYAERVWNITEGAEDTRIHQAIEKTRGFFEDMGVKTNLGDHGITEKDIPNIIQHLKDHGMTAIGEQQDITLEESERILREAL
jgi:NADP-dependent alcohol dehydrogenase